MPTDASKTATLNETQIKVLEEISHQRRQRLASESHREKMQRNKQIVIGSFVKHIQILSAYSTTTRTVVENDVPDKCCGTHKENFRVAVQTRSSKLTMSLAAH
jgi:hypothetical protein